MRRRKHCRSLVEFLKDPQKFQKLGGAYLKGVLLVGHPGTNGQDFAGRGDCR